MTPAGPWICYRAVFSAEAPIHIGWHTLGLIERTRYYIPARAIWGATVAALAPRLNAAAGVPEMYRQTEQLLEKCLRFTCFFAADPANPVREIWRPQYKEDGLHYGSLSGPDFESRFVFSQTSAALDPSSFTALDGALHESEFLAYTDQAGLTSKRLHFTGYFIAREPIASHLKTALATVTIGADRNYGWGKLRLRTFEEYRGPIFDEFDLRDLQKDEPLITTRSQEAFLPSHLIYQNQDDEKQPLGDLELVGGRNWEKNEGSGRQLDTLTLCWAAGSRLRPQSAFHIGPRGLWAET